jgi:hypothetical protein
VVLLMRGASFHLSSLDNPSRHSGLHVGIVKRALQACACFAMILRFRRE